MARPDLSSGMAANLSRAKKPSRREALASFLDDDMQAAAVAKQIIAEEAPPIPESERLSPTPPPPAVSSSPAPEPSAVGSPAAALTLHTTSHDTTDDTSHGTLDALADTPSDITSHEMSDAPSESATSQPASHLTSQPTLRQASHPAGHPIIRQSERMTLHQTQHPTERMTLRHTDMFDPVYTLTWKQGMVLYHMVNRPGYITQRAMIEEHTGLPLPTIRDSIKRLTAEGFISKPVKYVQKTFQGLTYTVNRELCERFLSLRGHEFESGIEPEKVRHSNRHTLHPTERQTYHPTLRHAGHPSSAAYDVPSDELATSSSSSRSFIKPTTAENPEISLEHPELTWWTEQGLTVDQVLAWMKELNISSDRIQQLLKWAAADIPAKRDPILKPIDWFYKIISAPARTYYKPSGYKSYEDLELEREIAEQEALEERNRQRAEIRQKKRLALLEEQFLDILDDPKGEDYKRLAATVSPLFKAGTKMWENAMRDAFLTEQGEI